MGEELRITDLQNQIQQLRSDITQLNSQLYRQSDQILDIKEVLAEDRYMQTKILSTLDDLAKLVEILQQSITVDAEKESEPTETIKNGESVKSRTALNYVTIAYNISLILLTVYQLYSNVLKNAASGGLVP